MKKAIVIPSYNAEKTLPSVLKRIPTDFWNDGIAVIVNDCSPDNTGRVADDLASQYPGLRVEHHPKNLGYGGAQKTGLRRALREGAEAFAIVHADGQYAPELVLQLLDPILKGEAHLVQGSRFKGGGALRGGMPLHRYLPNIALTAIENLAFGTRLAEFHSGYVCYSGELLRKAPFERTQNNYCCDAEMIVFAHLLGWKTVEIPIPTRYDDEISSLKPIPYGINVLKMVGRFLRGDYRRMLEDHARAAPQA
jgi:glycosyltransferase involved in cell wall biosynthesis